MMTPADIQYVADEEGALRSVLVPIAVWQEILSELETQHLLSSEAMRQRILDARAEGPGVDLNKGLARLGLG